MTIINELEEESVDGLLWMDRTDVDAQIGARKVNELCSDDDSRIGADETILNTMMAKAEKKVCSILLRSFRTVAEIVKLMEQDQFARSSAADIASEYMSRRKGDFASDEGKGRYFQPFKEACDYFKSMSHGGTETVAQGVSNVQSGATQRPRVQPEAAVFIFAPEKNFRGPPGRGGF